MAITLRDIAERTGVSPSVVSTVLSGRENGTFVSKTTRQRVLDMARQLNYVPVRAGRPRGSRRLRRQHTEQFIGVWTPAGASMSFCGMAELQATLNQVPAADASDDEASVSLGLRLISHAELPRLDTLGLAGILVLGDSPLPRTAAIANLPTVQIGEPDHASRDAYTYFLDSFAAGREIGDHLWKLGHRTLAFVAPASKPRVTRHRWQGLQSIWVERGASHAACVPAPYDTDKQAVAPLREQADQAVRKLYAPNAPAPTAIVCFDEAVTAYALQSLTRLGKSVPSDVSVAAFGDSPDGAEAMSPPVTSIRLPLDQMCRAALDLLISRAGESDESAVDGHGSGNGSRQPDTAGGGGQPVREQKFAGSLVVRESTAPPA